MNCFTVSGEVFEKLPHYCLGVVVAKGIDNRGSNCAITALLDQHVREFSETHAADNVRDLPGVKAYRDAFQTLGMNPNKFMCSIEALAKRVQKGGNLPHINPIVDLGNAFSIQYLLPMGAHDIDKLEDGIAVRFSTQADHFLPMGTTETEIMPDGELAYVSGHTVKTRRWIWRQSDDGKITEDTSHVFFPIDAFRGVNEAQALQARDELSVLLQKEFGCEVSTGFVDKDHPTFTF